MIERPQECPICGEAPVIVTEHPPTRWFNCSKDGCDYAEEIRGKGPIEPALITCTPGCQGCSCFISPPCSHCEYGHGQEHEIQ